MRLRPAVVGFAILAGLLLAPGSDAIACSCASSGAACQGAFQVDAVFVGTVQRITALRADGSPLPAGVAQFPQSIRVEFSIEEAFRGVQGATVTVMTAGSGPACGYDFKLGERYVVYAHHSRNGVTLTTGICTRTRPLAAATEDIEFLQTLSSPASGARLSGTVVHQERNLSKEPFQDHGTVPNVLVTARGEAGTANARTDSQGHYEMRLPPGKYEVAIEPLQGFSTNGLRETIELRDPRACAVADFSVRFDGRIKGVVVLESGDTPEGVLVDAMAAERVGQKGNIEVVRTKADASGAFQFTDLSPGRYVVGVDLIRHLDPARPFPTTYYPGTPDPALATVVQIDGGQQIELGAMTLPSPRRALRLTGTVFFEDGRPAPRAGVVLWDSGERRQQVAMGNETAVDGSFSFVVHEGLSYTISADFWNERERRQVRGSLGPIVVSGDVGPVKVVLSGK